MDKIRHLLSESIGLDPESIGVDCVDRLVSGHMKSINQHDPEMYWRQLRSCEVTRARLVEKVVINETWFFRDPDAFETITRAALKETFPLRILSLPCATGEEPYSLAIALLNRGVHDFSIDGLDVSAQALDKARLGIFGRNSFRGHDQPWRETYFSPHNDQWQLRRDLFQRVRFEQANVADPKFLDNLGLGLYDIVVFRHLIIYLDALTRQAALAQFHQHLKPGGLLCVGASEAGYVPGHLFRPIPGIGMFEAVHSSAPFIRKLVKPRKAYRTDRDVPPHPVAGPVQTPQPKKPVEELLEVARQQANRGNIAQAKRLCLEILTLQGPRLEVFLLLAMVASANGDLVEQEKQLRKVVYLDPDHGDALLHLASLAEHSGDKAQAGRLRSRARRVQAGARPQ